MAVLRTAATGSPRVGAMANSLTMVDSNRAKDSSKAPTIPLTAREVVERVVEAIIAKISPLQLMVAVFMAQVFGSEWW